VLLAMALQWWERAAGAGEPVLPEDADHVAVELTEAAFSHRDRCAADGGALLGVELSVDRSQAARRGGPRAYLHTTGVAVADAVAWWSPRWSASSTTSARRCSSRRRASC
jgi:gamma-glutamyltranspeptidase/glutathione hydrolase